MKITYSYRNYTAADDALLWNDFRSGNMMAFGAIYHHFYRLLYNYGYTIFADKDLIKDCLHELFLELWERREGLAMVNSIRNYLLVSFRRKIIYLLKSKSQSAGFREEPVEPSQASREDQLIEKERQFIFSGQFKKIFGKLSRRRQEAIYLRYCQELSYPQISEIMEIQYQTVRDLVSKGIKTLREHLHHPMSM